MKYLSILIILIFISACSPKIETALTSPMALENSFSSIQEKTILAESADTPMRLFLTTNESDSLLLRKKSGPVTADPNDEVLGRVIDRLFATVRDSLSLGVGIAAPQVGISKNIIWVQRFDKEGYPFEVYLNPVIQQYTNKKQPCMEGCLSIPDKQAETQTRAYAILLEYDTREGEHITEMIEDFTAVIFQHEIDHLNGILFIDHLEEH